MFGEIGNATLLVCIHTGRIFRPFYVLATGLGVIQKYASGGGDDVASMPEPKVILTTEKDATRLMAAEGLSDEVKSKLYVLPMRIVIMQNQEEEFTNKILGYVYKNSRNSILAKRKDDHKSQNSDSTGNRPRTISFRNN